MSENILQLIEKEVSRQRETLMMIPSENYTYPGVRRAVGSVLMHKYSEGYPGKRYYQGNGIVDEIEIRASNLAQEIFDVEHVNVQPYSGSPANAAVYMALLDSGDTIMGLSLDSGGHLTHGHPKITFSGKFFNSIQYNLNDAGVIDYDALSALADKHKPKLIVAGITAYSRILDWKRFSEIADAANAWLLADISHIAGLVAARVHPSPSEYAHVIMTTTHKTLRGPRGAMIMVTRKGLIKDERITQKIDRAVFPGLQGGPHDNQTAGIAIALEMAKTRDFKKYAEQTIANAKALSDALINQGFTVVSGGTDNHMFLVDLRTVKLLGKDYATALELAGIVVNYNAVPNDPQPPLNPSGIRVGTPALTVRGMKETEMETIAELFGRVAEQIGDEASLMKIADEVRKLCTKFPIDLG